VEHETNVRTYSLAAAQVSLKGGKKAQEFVKRTADLGTLYPLPRIVV
jgi:hypothetical protein